MASAEEARIEYGLPDSAQFKVNTLSPDTWYFYVPGQGDYEIKKFGPDAGKIRITPEKPEKHDWGSILHEEEFTPRKTAGLMRSENDERMWSSLIYRRARSS